MNTSLTGIAAGVPYLAVAPNNGARPDAPVVLAWHLFDPPCTQAAFAAALPLAGLDAWRIYFGLPLSPARPPEGGVEKLMRLGYQDAPLHLYGPCAAQAVAELPAALAQLRDELRLGDGPIGILGGSMGAGVAQSVLIESGLAARAAVLVSPLVQLRAVVALMAAKFGITYTWSPETEAIADRLDFVARAEQTAKQGEPATLIVVGDQDAVDGFQVPAVRLRAALGARYADATRVQLSFVPGMPHELTEAPGIEPAPQNAHAAEVDRQAVAWFRTHLS